MYPSGKPDQLERPSGYVREETHMSVSATTLRLQSELCALVALDADTYFNEPERFVGGENRGINPVYTQVRARRRRIEQLRMQLQEARFGSVGAPHGVYSSRKVA